MTRYTPARHYLTFGIVAVGLAGFSVWLGLDWAPAFIPAALFFLSAVLLLALAFQPAVEIHEGYLAVGKRIVPWMDIRRLDRPGNWLSPLIVRITLFDDSRMMVVYPGDLDSCNSLLRHLRRLSRDALIDGVPYRQFWGEVLAPGGDRRQIPPPRYRMLVREEGPARADIAVLLAGDYYGNRIVRAAELVKQGNVPNVLVSGPNMLYGYYECDLEISFAVKRGYPESWFIRAPNEALSTREEAAAILPDLRRRGVHRFLLVTSDYHTARAARIFTQAAFRRPRAAAPDLDMRVVAAPDDHFRADGWWRNREGRKIFAIEWLKTVANLLGM